MAKNKIISESVEEEVYNLQAELFRLLLKKAHIKENDVIETAKKYWISQNLDLLTESELEKYKNILLSK